MNKIAIVLALAALGFAGWQYSEGARLRTELDAAQDATTELRADVDRLTRAFATPSETPIEMPDRVVVLDDSGQRSGSGATLAPRGASPEVIARAVQDLQTEMAELRKENEALEEKVDANPMMRFKRPKFIHDVDQAVKTLGLNAGQRSDVERIVDYTKRELEDLYNIPNAEGKTWKDVSQVKMQGGDAENGGFAVVMSNFAEIQKFRMLPLPGSNETFGEREKRIRGQGKQDVRDVLNEEQQKTYDEARTDALFGSPMSPMVSFATTVVGTSSDD